MIPSQIKYCGFDLRMYFPQSWTVLYLLILTFLTIKANAQIENEDVLKVDVPSIVEPGKYFALFVDIKKKMPKDTISELSMSIPERWRLLSVKKTIKDNNLIRYIYTVASPSDANASKHELFIMFVINGKAIRKQVNVLVKRTRDIQVMSFDVPEFVKEGDSLKIHFLVNNLGNADEKLFVKSAHGNLEKLSDSLLLKKKESIQVTVSQKVPKTTESSWYITTDLTVFLKDSLIPITTIVSTTVYGVENKPQDHNLRFPLEIGGVYLGTSSQQQQSKAFQYDFKGRGFLDFANKHFVEFTIHGPDQFRIPITGSYEVLALKYVFQKKSNLQIGDYQLKLSNLVEFGRFSRGFRYDYDFKKVGVSVFYAKPRFFYDIDYECGVNLRYNHSTKFQLSVDVVKKSSQSFLQTRTTSLLYCIASKYNTNHGNIETELAVSESLKKDNLAFFNNMNFNWGRFYLSSTFIYASKDFQGFYRNSWLAVNSLNYQFSTKVSVGFTHNLTRINPNLDLITYNSSPYTNSLMVMANYQINEKNQLRFSYNWQEREDRMMPQNFHFKEDFANIMYNYLSKKVDVSYSGRFGSAKNLLIPNDASILRQSFSNSLNPQIRIRPYVWFGAILEHQQTSKYSANNAITNYYFYGSTLKIRAKNWLNVSLMYRNNFTPDALVEMQSFINGMVNINVKEKHSFSVNFGKTFVPYHQSINVSNRDMLYFSFKYSLKLNLPIARNKKNGAIHGRVTSTDADIRLSDILIKLGDKKALTDAKGNFYFNDLLPARYLLKVDNTAVQSGVTSVPKSPIEVVVKQDSVHKIKINLVRTGDVLGKINFLKANYQKDSLQEIPMILVKFEQGSESFTTKVNEHGEFCYKEILPGEWKLSAWLPARQEQYIIENPEQVIQVVSSKVSQVNFSVITQNRKLRFSDKTFQLHVKQNK